MSSLLEEVLEAHGGFDRWQRFSRVEADAVTGGGLFPLKGLMPDLSIRRMTVWLKEERASVAPFGAADQRTSFTPGCGMGLSTERFHRTRLEHRLGG